jgi:antitoxin HigA-1
MKTQGLSNITPGEIIRDQYLKPLGMTQSDLANGIGVPRMRVSEIIRGVRKITPDTAVRLGLFFKKSPEFWLRLQMECDLRGLRRQTQKLRDRVKPCQAVLKRAA